MKISYICNKTKCNSLDTTKTIKDLFIKQYELPESLNGIQLFLNKNMSNLSSTLTNIVSLTTTQMIYFISLSYVDS